MTGGNTKACKIVIVNPLIARRSTVIYKRDRLQMGAHFPEVKRNQSDMQDAY